MHQKRIHTFKVLSFFLILLPSCAIQKVKIDLTEPKLPIEQLDSQERKALIESKQRSWASIQENNSEKLDLAMSLGFLYFQDKQYPQSRHYFSTILNSQKYMFRDYAFFYLGNIALEENNCSGASTYLQTLQKEFPESSVLMRYTETIQKKCPALYVEVPNEPKALKTFQTGSLFEYASIAFENRDYPQAISKYKSYLIQPSIEEPKIEEALSKLATIYKRLGNDAAYEKTLWKLARHDVSDIQKFPYNPKWLYEIAKFYWNKEKISAAKKYFLKLILWPNHKYIGQSFFVLGKLAADEKKYDTAATYLAKAEDYPLLTTSADEIAYLRGWYLYKAKKIKPAIQAFGKFRDDFPNSDYFSTVTYWLAKWNEALKDSVDAKKLYQELISANPYSYYAARSMNRLKQNILKRNISQKESLRFSKNYLRLLEPTSFERGSKLVQLGLGDAASFELGQAASFDNIFKANWKFQYYLSSLFQQSGDYVSSFVILTHLQKDYMDDLPDQFAYLLYPKRYWSLIEKYAKKYNMDPYLVISIMRQESAFDPDAISGADAYGLMQITPTMAKEMGKKINRPLADPKDLFDPQTNIQYCTFYLSQLLKRKKENLILSLAIYNSNDAAVQKWVGQSWADDPEAFIEDIPYSETRNYVKLILRNYTNYLLLYEGKFQVY